MNNAVLLQLDIETLSLHPCNALITEIGAHVMVLDEKLNVIHDEKQSHQLLLETQQQLGREIDVSTVQWWLKQSDEAREPLTQNENRIHPVTALTHINEMLENAKTKAGVDSIVTVLASAADFDFPNIQSLAKSFNIRMSWSFMDQHSQRTLRFMVPKSQRLERPADSIHHNGGDDAEYQNKVLLDLLQNKNQANFFKNFFFYRKDGI